jgi:hypothetical protein
VTPGAWHPLLAFAHLAERAPDAPPGAPDPAAEVERQAEAVLGDLGAFHHTVQDSGAPVPRARDVVFVPAAAGVEFNPPSRGFRWCEPVHREEFRFRAGPECAGRTVRGRLTVFLGSIILAEVPLSFRVEAGAAPPRPDRLEVSRARPYRRIFASYSHRDAPIVEQFEQLARALGDDYLRDVTRLRSGEVWDQVIEAMIADADVFQLFWSTNSMRSPYVRREWECALARGGPSFVRPVYWEDPLPSVPAENLPPEALRRLHFQRVPAGAPAAPAAGRPAAPPAAPAPPPPPPPAFGEFAVYTPDPAPAAAAPGWPPVGVAPPGPLVPPAPSRPTAGVPPVGGPFAPSARGDAAPSGPSDYTQIVQPPVPPPAPRRAAGARPAGVPGRGAYRWCCSGGLAVAALAAAAWLAAR